MVYNLKQASEDKYPVEINGRMVELPGSHICQLIKKKMKGDLAVQKLFEKFEVDLDQLDNLNIEIKNLNGIYAETDVESMVLDKGLFEDGRFFEDSWFIVCHELVHLCTRLKEDSAYLNDPEESLGFVISIATELARGTDMDTIWNRIFPKISFHFNNEADAREFFIRSIEKAKQMLM